MAFNGVDWYLLDYKQKLEFAIGEAIRLEALLRAGDLDEARVVASFLNTAISNAFMAQHNLELVQKLENS